MSANRYLLGEVIPFFRVNEKKDSKKVVIPNTTSHLDGGLFAPMKMLLNIHRGIGIEMKKKLILDYLENIRK